MDASIDLTPGTLRERDVSTGKPDADACGLPQPQHMRQSRDPDARSACPPGRAGHAATVLAAADTDRPPNRTRTGIQGRQLTVRSWVGPAWSRATGGVQCCRARPDDGRTCSGRGVVASNPAFIFARRRVYRRPAWYDMIVRQYVKCLVNGYPRRRRKRRATCTVSPAEQSLSGCTQYTVLLTGLFRVDTKTMCHCLLSATIPLVEGGMGLTMPTSAAQMGACCNSWSSKCLAEQWKFGALIHAFTARRQSSAAHSFVLSPGLRVHSSPTRRLSVRTQGRRNNIPITVHKKPKHALPKRRRAGCSSAYCCAAFFYWSSLHRRENYLYNAIRLSALYSTCHTRNSKS